MYLTDLEHFNDLINSATSIWICLGAAPIYCLIFLGLLKCATECVLYASIIVVQIGLIAAPIGLQILRAKGMADFAKEKEIYEKYEKLEALAVIELAFK